MPAPQAPDPPPDVMPTAGSLDDVESIQDRNWSQLKQSAESWRQRAIDAEQHLATITGADTVDWRQRAIDAEAALTAAGVPIGDDGTLDPDQHAALQEKIRAAEEHNTRSLLTKAGFKPESGEGIVLAQALAAGQIESEDGQSLAKAIRQYAKNTYGWNPQVILTPVEEVIAEGQRRLDALNAASWSDPTPPEGLGTLDEQIALAEAMGNHQYARQLKSRAVVGNMLADKRRR